MKKIVIAIDAFKGCLTSFEAGQAAAEGVRSVYPGCEICCLPVADGGEGVSDVLVAAFDGRFRTLRAHGPLMEMQDTRYGISGDGQTAFIEMATISGLPLVPPEKRNPMLTTTWGTGDLIRDALEQGCRNFVIGIGGSATNDAGLGMLQALGFRFLDKAGRELGTGGRILAEVNEVDISFVHPALKEARFRVACDVANPFYGPEGAAYVFAPQKGADNDMVKKLDAGLCSLAEVIHRSTGKDISCQPGAGAAGGMGGGLMAFLDARLEPGIRLLLDVLHFSDRIREADLIITGEGRADRQTIMGKVPSGILEEADRQHIPVVLLAGSVADADYLNNSGFRGVFSVTPAPVSLEEAMEPAFACTNIRRTATQICHLLQAFQV